MKDRGAPVPISRVREPAPLGPLLTSGSALTATAGEAEIRRIAEECQAEAERLLAEHRAQLDALARALLRNDSLDEAEILEVTGISSSQAKEPALPAPGGRERG